jgi:STE24 endopeptidase
MLRRLMLIVGTFLLMTTLVSASEPPATPSDQVAAQPAAFDAEAATTAYMATMSPAAVARSNAYFEGGYWLILWDTVAAIGCAWLLLGTKLSARIRDWAERTTRLKWLQTGIYAIAYTTLATLILLPWSAYEGYFREHQYGMSNQDIGAWLGDTGKGLVLTLIFGTLALVAIYAVIRKVGKLWWLWGAGISLAFFILQAIVGPTYLEPVFNKFYPLAESPLKQEILSLARANEVPATQVYEFDASKQTTKISAHVSGLLGTAQISLNDNLMNRASPGEVKAVLGHEMGHYVLNHEYKGIVFLAVIGVIGFALVAKLFDRLAARHASRWQVRGIADPAGLPLLIALFTVYAFLLTPILNTIGRTLEIEADAFGLNAARQPDGFASIAVQLSEYRKMQPGPIEEFVFFDHPSGWNRIHRAMVWKAENIRTPDISAYDAAHHPPGTTP